MTRKNIPFLAKNNVALQKNAIDAMHQKWTNHGQKCINWWSQSHGHSKGRPKSLGTSSTVGSPTCPETGQGGRQSHRSTFKSALLSYAGKNTICFSRFLIRQFITISFRHMPMLVQSLKRISAKHLSFLESSKCQLIVYNATKLSYFSLTP